MQLRLIVLPAVLRQLADAPRPDMSDRAAREAWTAPTPGPEGSAGRYTADSPYVLAFAFAVSPAIYGLVAAILLGHGWLAAPFGAIALVALALLAPYLASEMQRALLARRMQAA